MSLGTDNFRFNGFVLDVREKVLFKDGAPVAITPKTFVLLQTLLENHGHLVEKELLLKTIWPDSFVEEGNLSFTVNLLRKALSDDPHEPQFIETVRKRGYRFVADVRKDSLPGSSHNGDATPGSQAVGQERVRPKRRLVSGAAILLIGLIAGGLWYARSPGRKAEPPIMSASFSSERLSTNGKILNAVISPDGKKLAYTNGLGPDKQSVWLRQLDSSNNTQIIPPSDDFYFNLSFSPDGNFIYFVRGEKPGDPTVQAGIFRISTFGGVATKLVNDVQGGISISTDGTKISFVRCYLRDDDYCSLWTADAADGGNERKLVSRPSPIRIGDNKFSPDGRTIAFGTGQSRTGANEFGLGEVDVASGAEKEVTHQKFFDIRRLIWLPDRSGLLMTALQYPDKRFRIWHVSEVTGEIAELTKDSEDYSGLSLNNDADILVTTQIRPDFHLDAYPVDDATRFRQVSADAASVAFAPDGKIIYSAGRRGEFDIWSSNSDGAEQRQLTNGALDDWAALVSPDGQSIFFTSNRTGQTHVWRMRPDGSDQVQITTNEGGRPIGVSADGRSVYYHSTLQKTLWSVSLGDGREQLILDKRKEHFAIAPDASQVAFDALQGGRSTLVIVALPTGATVKRFNLGNEKDRIISLTWSTDGKKLFYLANNPLSGNTLWLQPLDKQTPRRIARLPDEEIRNSESLAVSADSRRFAVIQGDWKRDAVLLKGLM